MKREEINDLAQLVQIEKLEKLYKKIDKNHNVKILTQATEQTLLVPVKDPISGGSFYAGEVLVTSTIVQVEEVKGWSMVMDLNEEISLYTAVLDASFEANICKEEIESLLIDAKNIKEKDIKNTNKKVNSTRVSFDLM
ncbi:phosphonate C-P lyase system protein PhnG [Poseidonibacter lekithochrous]|jgi:alpha-D-ribose 1-methylphosphonate 5-triphosphate synthase subunit PhnG|uniref:phosphonate C-P lyase system protein PhnG n=1 Tax=Poseidonibacter TaxID=2321187 RepID=UPI001C08B90C|nr:MULTISPECIES: phosphonate C-P lyase system protein PhnG [Poseidonibacter]MBU3015039.1 phosphonate C-P lyase system protein PhnG [Poseidonibacter lekithochrous]MDO6828336.1 phosphonate C-P lyase system protein PhnG [Poseidonibacter sp. 1_MG-2023]